MDKQTRLEDMVKMRENNKKEVKEEIFCKKCEKLVDHIDWIDGYCDKCIDK